MGTVVQVSSLLVHFRLVPRIAERAPLTARVHEAMGHFGTKRTLSLLTPEYWWAGMYVDVATFVQSCSPSATVLKLRS